MALIPKEYMPYVENGIYLPMLLVILQLDRQTIDQAPFKFKSPYVQLLQHTEQTIRLDLKKTKHFLREHRLQIHRLHSDDLFTDYRFIYNGYEDSRRYLNARLKNRTEELLRMYLTKMEI